MSIALIALGSMAGGSIVGWLAVRAAIRGTIPGLRDHGPECQSCGKATERPYLWSNPHTHWHCASCERKFTDMMFSGKLRPSAWR
ncbi:hypothetical protein ACFWDI_28285 [Streptomyces sp. NPDC060064]|uniref:hypothetical protein n=1 Tax=Streptomyces sp. NPDC060064 TaxID=3347049 RepID=UPI00367677FB